ncbi:SDR family NAD(P)-dependent oxidoreductase [Nocardioides sp.]|uniref:SDR family NAD(P)-dependent oxidoreductase n=1 Tax=Nocardioides sp. TaxID=35761 RepID=UPI00286E8B2A|nr:SDR family NAD(P)-dependent oxidoreductase [Nocardioides sp.]
MSRRELSGARIAVVGASGALGSLVARELAGRGARLLLVGRDRGRLAALGIDAPVVVAEVGDATAGDTIADAARAAYGGLDGLLNAAGVVAFGPLLDTPDEVIEELFLTNVVGPLFLVRRLLPLLEESQGFVLQISAVVAERALPGMTAYSASKAALSAVATALRTELRRSRVAVHDVRPPHTETGLATRPLTGQAPRLPQGLAPEAVARRIVEAIEAGELDLGADAFG